jgi:hypothetical protein
MCPSDGGQPNPAFGLTCESIQFNRGLKMQVNNAPASFIVVQNPEGRLMVGAQPGQPVLAAPAAPAQRSSPRAQPAVAAIQAALPPRVPSTAERIRRNWPVLLTIAGISNATGTAVMLGRTAAFVIHAPVSSEFQLISTTVAPVMVAGGIALMGTVVGAHCVGTNDQPAAAPAHPEAPAEPLPPIEFTVVTVESETGTEMGTQTDVRADASEDVRAEAVPYTQGDSTSVAEHADEVRLDMRELEMTLMSAASRPTV